MNIGNRVRINTNVHKYKKYNLDGLVGYIERINVDYDTPYGVRVDGKFNSSSSDGLFWLDEAWLQLINDDHRRIPSDYPTPITYPIPPNQKRNF